MATAELTDRQKEIRKLLDDGKTPPEIAAKLKISDNAVYQQLRRMRQRNGASATPARARSGGKRSTRRSTGRSASRSATPSPRAQTPGAITPLQAIRHRRSIIEHEISESQQRLRTAQREAEQAADAHGKLTGRHTGELKQLAAAERALGHSKPAPRKRAPRKRPAKAKAPAPTTGS